MTGADHKKILLIGGVIAGAAIILATRLLFGDGFKKAPPDAGNSVGAALKAARDEAAASYREYQENRTGNDAITALKARVEATAETDGTIKELGEKLKTASTEDETP